jgi:putative ABC transport system substrate-binding protein
MYRQSIRCPLLSGREVCFPTDFADMFRRAATYVDRILRGAKPAELPVQPPVKFEIALNAKTAKTLGLEIPPGVLGIAEETNE